MFNNDEMLGQSVPVSNEEPNAVSGGYEQDFISCCQCHTPLSLDCNLRSGTDANGRIHMVVQCPSCKAWTRVD